MVLYSFDPVLDLLSVINLFFIHLHCFVDQSGEPIALLEEEKANSNRMAEELELLRKQLDHWITNTEGEDTAQVQKQLNYYQVPQQSSKFILKKLIFYRKL